MAEKKNWRDYSKYQNPNRSGAGSTDKGSSDWRNYSKVGSATISGGNIVNRVNSWFDSYNNYLSDYQKRYEGRKYTYEDAYVSDHAEWQDAVTKRSKALDTEAGAILTYLYQNKDNLDANWIIKVRDAINNAKDAQRQTLRGVANDSAFWNRFAPSEEQAAAGKTAEMLYGEWQAGQKQYADDMVYDVDAGMLELEKLKGERDSFLAEQEKKRQQAQEDKSFWDKLGEWLGTTPDTTVPLAGASGFSSGNGNNTTQIDKRISALEEQIERAKYVQGYEGYMDNMDAKDYAENSRFNSTRTDVAMDDASYSVYYGPVGTDGAGGEIQYSTMYEKEKLFTDFLHDYINGQEDALAVASVNDTSDYSYFHGHDEGFLQTMTDDEVGVYNYLYNTKGQESADAFLTHIESDLKGRKRAQEQAFWASYAKSDPVGSSVFSTLISPLKGVSYIGQAADLLDDGKMEQDAGYNRFSYIPSTIRNQVSTTIENSGKWGKVGSFAYNTGMSMADFLFNTAVSGGNQALSLGIMGSGAAADATLAAKDRGLSDGQAFSLGTIAGIAEVAMEKISLKAWFDGDMTDGALRYILHNALEEGREEAGTSAINLLADVMIAGDKSEWNMAMQAYIAEGKSPAEAFGLVAAENAAQIGLDALGGALSGFAIGGGAYAGSGMASSLQYGNIAKNKDFAQKLTAEGIEFNPTSKYVQKMKAKVDGGKSLSGMQVRNILAKNQEQITADDMKKIRQAAEKRLTDLGQTENVSKLAEIATKWATGQEISRAERKLLTHSQYGSEVAHDLLQDSLVEEVNSEGYGSKAIRSILDKMASMEHPNAYKSLESRMEGETPAKVSDTGKAVIRGTDTEVDLKRAKVTEFVTDKATGKIKDMVLEVNGKAVKASEIDYADGDQSYLFSAVTKIENITPADATVIIRDYDPSSGLSVSEYLNGMDEGFTYGYHNYSEADLKAGDFAPKLGDTMAKSAYVLGQTAREKSKTAKTDAIKRMRTAAEAKLTQKQKNAQLKARIKSKDVEVYFEDGETVVKFDKALQMEYEEHQIAAVKYAEFLSKLGIGGKYYFYKSYVKDGVRVYKDADGNEKKAPNGKFVAEDGSIHIDLYAGNDGQGITLFTLSHELTHFIRHWSEEKFDILADFLIEEYGKTDMSMHERVLAKQKFLENARGKGAEVSYDEAFEEVVADAMSTMLADGNLHEKLAKLKTKDENLFDKIKKFFDDLIAKFQELYKKLPPEQQDAADVRDMKDAFDKIQTAFAEALVEASENFHASEQVLAQAGIAVNAETDSGSLLSVRDVLNDKDRKKVAKALADRFNVTEKEAMDWLKAETSLASIILNPKYSAFLDYEADPNEVAIKQNSDYPQGTVDFSNICKKRREFTQVMNRILRNFPNHVFAATDLAKIRTIMGDEGMTLPCGICYVEDRRQLDSIVAQDFIDGLKLYREGSKTRPDGKPFNANQLKGLQLTDGDSYVPTIYELVTLEGRNSLKEKNPNMEAAWVKYNNARGMQAVRLLTNEAEYKRQILKYTPKTVKTKNDYGGLRIYSFSDAEMFHLIDIVQVLTDCAAVGLKVQGYTKVNEYAKAVKDTGEKINRSLIPLGDLGYHIENGKVVLDYDPVEGIDIHSEDFFDSKDNPNVGNIVIGINPTQIRTAMVSDFIDYIIPFHTGQSAEVLGEKGIAAWVNYKDSQSEVDLATGKKSAHQINIYTEVFQAAEDEGKPIRNKRDFVNKFLAVCKENGLKPRFAEFLNMDANGDYVYTEGYHKFLVDFKTFAQTEVGEYLPQMPVKPIFEDAYITSLLTDYVAEQKAKDVEVAEQMPKVIDRITNEIVKTSDSRDIETESTSATRFSHRDTSSVPADISSFVDKALTDRRSDQQLEITIATKWDNSVINKLGRSWSGKYTGSKRVITSEYVRHIINSHGNAFLEALQGQLYMDGDAIKIALSNLRAGKGRVIGGTYSRRGNPTIVTEIPINGYTLYAEEPLENLRGIEIEGRTIYMKPTSTTALKPTQRTGSIPQRRGGLTPSIDATSRIVNNYLVDADGKPVELHGVAIQNLANVGRRAYGTVALSTDVNALNTVYSHISNDTFKVRVQNPYIVESSHPIIVDEDFYDGNKRRTAAEVILEKLDVLKKAGYDSIIMDYKPGDNYFVIVFDRKAVEPYVEEDAKTTDRNSERGDGTSNRHLLANAFEGITKSIPEYEKIQEYKGRIKIINEYEEKLAGLNAEIRKILFDPDTERDAKKLKRLQAEAKKVAENINRNDKKLLSLEASEPLRNVIQRERKKEAQRTKDHVKEIQRSKKVRAEQTELRHKIRKAVRDLDKILNRGNKKRNVKEDMKGFASKALELADYLFTDHISNDDLIRKGITVRMTPKEAALVKETEDILSQLYDNADSLTDEEFTRLDAQRKANEDKLRDLLTAQRNERLNTPVYNLFNDLVTEYASLKNSKQDAVKAAYNEELEKSLRAFMSDDDRVKILKNMRVADMTAEELNWLYRAYTMVLTNVRDANKFFAKGMSESIDKVATQIVTDFGSRKIPDKKLAIVAQKVANKIGWDYEKLYYALDRIGSDAFTKLIMNIADSENTVMQDVMEAALFRDEMVEKYGFNNWAVNKEIDREFLDNTGKKFKLTLGQLMALYAYSRREGAWDHIEYGGFVFGEAALTNPKPADSYKLTKEQCEAITGLLTKEQRGYAEDMQKFLSETMGEKGNEVSMLLYGIKMFGEKNYFPIHIAGQFKAQANESQAKAAAGFTSMSNAGFTHAQNPNAKAPFVLEGFNEIWVDHVNEMSRYHGTVPALEDLRRVMNRSTYSDTTAESTAVKAVMENHFGKEAVEYFDNLYREANSGAITDKLQKKSKKLLSLFRKNSVAYSLSVLIQQPASLVRAYALIDKKYFGYNGRGLFKTTVALTSGIAKAVSDRWTKAHTNAYNEMLKYAPGVTMAKEIGGFDTHTGGSIRSYLLDTNKSIKQKWQTGTALEKGKIALDVVDNNAIANLPNVADKIAWVEIWNACKRETLAKHKTLAPNSEEFLQIVGERFTEVIRATQVYDSMFAKSPMLKSKNLAVQYLVSFMNEPNTVANMAEKAVRDAANGNWKGGVKTAAVVIHSIIFTNVLKSIIYAMRDDDEEETYIEKYIEAVVGNMMNDFNPLSYIPLARDVWSLAQGYDVERADMAIVADAIDAMTGVIKNATTDTDGMNEEQLVEFDKKVTEANWRLVESLASFFGIPVKNIRREVMGVLNHGRIASANAGQTTAQSAWDKVCEAVLESIPFMQVKNTKSDKIFNAIVNGDAAYLERIKSTYKDESAYQSAVRSGIRDQYMSGKLDGERAKELLIEYAGKDEDEADSAIVHWTFCVENPKYNHFTEANVEDFRVFAEPENISLEVFDQYIKGTRGLETIKDEWGDVDVSKREQVLEVIDSLPLTDDQKDALYLASGYSESKIWDVPW